MNMEQQAKPILCETISAVRREDGKRNVPFDLVAFLLKEARFAEGRVRARRPDIAKDAPIPDGTLEHVHLIGDALVAAEAIAVDCGSSEKLSHSDRFRSANERVNALFSNAEICEEDRKLHNSLKELVDEKKALVQSLAEMFGLKVTVSSAIDFIRQKREIANRVNRVLSAIFRDIDQVHHTVDVAQYEKERDGMPIEAGHFANIMSWRDLARSTLPKSKLLSSGEPIEQARRAYYAATEGGIHAGVIDLGGEVITYEGSEHAGNPPTKIITNMQRLVEVAVWGILQEHDLAREIHEKLSIEPRLDGRGIFPTPLSVRPTDPFTLEYDAARRELLTPLKLPLLIFGEDRKLRPVTAQEVLSVVVDSKSGGIAGPRSVVWKHNLCAIATLFNADEGRFDHPAVSRVMSMHAIRKQELKNWAISIVESGADKYTGPLVPDMNVELAGAFVEAIAYEVLEGMERILGKGAMAGSSATIVPMSNGSATPEAAAPAPEAAATAPQAPAPEVSAPASEQPPASGAEPKE